MNVCISLAIEAVYMVVIYTLSNIAFALISLVDSVTSPEVLSALITVGLTGVMNLFRFWLRARERRKSEAQAWRDALALVHKRLDEIAGKRLE